MMGRNDQWISKGKVGAQISSQSSARSFHSGSLAASSFSAKKSQIAQGAAGASNTAKIVTISKKRTIDQLTKPEVENGSGGMSGGAKTATGCKDASALWIEKYAPKSLDELAVNKKKVEEFIRIVEENGGGGFLVLQGAPGSCKNALIDTYCS